MAILTKPLSGVQKKPEEQQQQDEKLVTDTDLKVPVKDDWFDENDNLDYLYKRVSRVGLLTNYCLMVSLIALLILGVGAGIHSYQVFALRNSYAGMCRLPLKKFMSPDIKTAIDKLRMLNAGYPYDKLDEMIENQHEKETVEFDFDIDVEEENYEVLELPEIFLGRYMHDFSQNITVIIDSLRDNCYIMPLDRQLVPPPKSMFDMIEKMKQGYYNLDFQEIRKNYRVMSDEIEHIEDYGMLATRACSNKDTYKLEELVGEIIVKRETSKLEKFGEFMGNTLVQYHIVNLDQ